MAMTWPSLSAFCQCLSAALWLFSTRIMASPCHYICCCDCSTVTFVVAATYCCTYLTLGKIKTESELKMNYTEMNAKLLSQSEIYKPNRHAHIFHSQAPFLFLFLFLALSYLSLPLSLSSNESVPLSFSSYE